MISMIAFQQTKQMQFQSSTNARFSESVMVMQRSAVQPIVQRIVAVRSVESFLIQLQVDRSDR